MVGGNYEAANYTGGGCSVSWLFAALGENVQSFGFEVTAELADCCASTKVVRVFSVLA